MYSILEVVVSECNFMQSYFGGLLSYKFFTLSIITFLFVFKMDYLVAKGGVCVEGIKSENFFCPSRFI